HRGRQGQRVARARLLLGRGDDPDVVAEPPRDGLEQPQAAGVHAVVVGQEDAHLTAYAGRLRMLQPRRGGGRFAPYSQQLGDLFTRIVSVLVKGCARKYSAPWGRAD